MLIDNSPLLLIFVTYNIYSSAFDGAILFLTRHG